MNDEQLFEAGELATLKAKHRTWVEDFSADRGNDGPKVVQAIFDYMAGKQLPGDSFVAWMMGLAVTMGDRFPDPLKSRSHYELAIAKVDDVMHLADPSERTDALRCIAHQCRTYLTELGATVDDDWYEEAA